jgi:hypothetical protein
MGGLAGLGLHTLLAGGDEIENQRRGDIGLPAWGRLVGFDQGYVAQLVPRFRAILEAELDHRVALLGCRVRYDANPAVSQSDAPAQQACGA